LQQQEFINSLFDEGNIFNGEEAVMLHMMGPVIGEDGEELVFLSGQKKTIGQTFKVVPELKDQNFILIKDDEAVAQMDWTCDKEEKSKEDESEADMSHDKRKSIL